MKASNIDVSKYVSGVGKAERLIPDILDLWEQVPGEIRGIAKLSARQMASLALAYAQADHWRGEHDRLRNAIERSGLKENVKNAEVEARLVLGPISVQGFSEEKKAFILREVRRWKGNRGMKEVDHLYPWLNSVHQRPRLREALGLSVEGMRRAIKRLKIRVKKPQSAKILADTIEQGEAFRLLDGRLARRRRGKEKSAQKIWDYYATTNRATAGFESLKRILET